MATTIEAVSCVVHVLLANPSCLFVVELRRLWQALQLLFPSHVGGRTRSTRGATSGLGANKAPNCPAVTELTLLPSLSLTANWNPASRFLN